MLATNGPAWRRLGIVIPTADNYSRFFSNAEVNNKCSIYNVQLKPKPSLNRMHVKSSFCFRTTSPASAQRLAERRCVEVPGEVWLYAGKIFTQL
jgi:hypothetical protein